MSASIPKPQVCTWFAMCMNVATATRSHPVLGEVPISERCDRKVNAIDAGTRS